MQKSSSSKYIEAFTSDIFNRFETREKCENTKQNRPTHAPSLQRTSNDIFNREFDEQNNNNNIQNKHVRKRGIKTYSMSSDIFNLKPPKNSQFKPINNTHKDPALRNKTNNSTVFSHCQNKDYIIKRQTNKPSYNPDNYITIQTPYQRQLNEFHNTTLNNKELHKPKYRNLKGSFVKDQQQINNSEHKMPTATPNKKRFNWAHNSLDSCTKANVTPQTKPSNTKIRKLLEMQSDIFNMPHKEKENEKAYETYISETESTFPVNNTQPNLRYSNSNGKTSKKFSKPNQLQAPPYKMDWKTINTEKYFTKYDDSKAETLSAYDRWQLCFTESDGNTCTHQRARRIPKSSKSESKSSADDVRKPDINLIKTFLQTTKEDKARKYLEGIPYYSANPSYYGSPIISPKNENVHLFTIKPNNTNTIVHMDDYSIRKLLFNEGIHAYDIRAHRSNVLGSDNAITFKVRENDSNVFEEKIKGVKEKLEKSENVTIEPVEKITVNRRKNARLKNVTVKPKVVYPDEDSNTREKVVRVDLQNKNNRFSNDFMQIDKRYKNLKIRDNYKPGIKKN